MHVCITKRKKLSKWKLLGKRGFSKEKVDFEKILICYLRRQVMCCFSPGVAEQAGGSTLR